MAVISTSSNSNHDTSQPIQLPSNTLQREPTMLSKLITYRRPGPLRHIDFVEQCPIFIPFTCCFLFPLPRLFKHNVRGTLSFHHPTSPGTVPDPLMMIPPHTCPLGEMFRGRSRHTASFLTPLDLRRSSASTPPQPTTMAGASVSL